MIAARNVCVVLLLSGCALTASNDSRLSINPPNLLQRFGNAPAPAAAVAPFEVAGAGSTIKIFGAPGCASWTIGSDADATTLQCVTSSTPQPPVAPTCSSITANPSALPGATGSTTLTANCTGKLNGYEWSSNVLPVSGFAFNTPAAQPTQTPTIAANTTFAVRAFNGVTPSNIVTVAVLVNQSTGPISCSGFSFTRVYDIDWNAPRRVSTGQIGQGEAIVIRFTTPPSATGSYSDITGAEYGGPQTTRYATISPTPCDFGEPPTLGWGAAANGSTVFLKFSVGPNSGGYYPGLNTGTMHYVNVKTTANCTTCDMIFDLHK